MMLDEAGQDKTKTRALMLHEFAVMRISKHFCRHTGGMHGHSHGIPSECPMEHAPLDFGGHGELHFYLYWKGGTGVDLSIINNSWTSSPKSSGKYVMTAWNSRVVTDAYGTHFRKQQARREV